MPREKAKALLTEWHEKFGDDQVSSQQQDLMMRVDAHIHELGEAEPVDPTVLDAVEMYLAEIEAEHPQGAAVIRQLLETLKNIGV